MLKRRLLIILFILTIFFTACSSPSTSSLILEDEISQSADTAQFHFIDVGQGDCTLIQSGDDVILIDAGTYESGSIICEYIESLGIESIDYFIGTHPHEDHLGGAAAVITLFDIENVFLNGEASTSVYYERMVDALIEHEITPVIPEIGKTYTLGPFKIEILSPDRDLGDTNANSIVTMITYKDIKALFTGDAERSVESFLVNYYDDLSADILQVGHHGSRNASSVEFLEAVYPAVAVIQCGKDNSYGHPHEEVIDRFGDIHTKLFRTDEQGTVIIRTDGKSLYDASGEISIIKEIQNDAVVSDYIGNRKSKVFHILTCANLPAEKNSVNFSSREDALGEGYRPCGNCNP